MYQDFPFDINDVANLLNIHVRHKNTASLDADCPFCGGKGKLNLNLKKDVFRCNRCGENGGMLNLYGKVYEIDNRIAYEEIRQALRQDVSAPAYQVTHKKIQPVTPEIINAQPAPDDVKNKTYTMLFSLLQLSDIHKQNLIERGFTEEQIANNGYKSTPVFGFRRLTGKLLATGCTVKGVPGFYQDDDGEWTIHFNPKSSGFIIPVRNIDGLIVGVQIRLDHPADGRKYMWLSSVNYPMGVTSGSPIHFVGTPGEKTVFITEGPLKGDIAHALSGRTFGCVPGANQYANLPTFLKTMKELGTERIYETYDMDKLLNTVCRGDYKDKCSQCKCFNKDWKNRIITCEKKQVKRENIQRGCRKLAEICRELELTGKTLTWDTDKDGNWAENVKGIDDYLLDSMS